MPIKFKFGQILPFAINSATEFISLEESQLKMLSISDPHSSFDAHMTVLFTIAITLALLEFIEFKVKYIYPKPDPKSKTFVGR